jgi:Fe-Mn family superoxide dismutase
MAFTLPALPYAYDALEPTIDAETMRLHHTKHHQAYVDKLNEGVTEDPGLAGKSLEEILGSISSQPKKVRNNGGGHWNHSFFWETMKAGGSKPVGRLAEVIDDEFGSFDAFKKKFAKRASASSDRVGCGSSRTAKAASPSPPLRTRTIL